MLVVIEDLSGANVSILLNPQQLLLLPWTCLTSNHQI